MNRVPEVDPRPTEQPDQGPQELVIFMMEKLAETKQREIIPARSAREKCCIYQMPRRLRDVTNNGKSYLPQTVSIGPYHLGSERVRDMDHYKWLALQQILERTGQDLNLYIDSIKQVEEQARAYYQQEVAHLSSDRFVEMMILDACFILDLLNCYMGNQATSNPVFSDQRIVDDILLDMVMLENQIPLFVIDEIQTVMFTAGNPGEHQKYQGLVRSLFNAEWLTGKTISIKEFNELELSLEQEECLHVLDVFRRSLLHAGPQRQWEVQSQGFRWKVCNKLVPGCLKRWLHHKRSPRRILSKSGQVIHRVTELRQGGVKFRKRNSNCFWDIKFKNGILEIPPIWIQDSTMTILLNVAAFEHCHLKISDAAIASYVVFMECLIKSPEDVSHLHYCGIIRSFLEDDAEVVDMFKSISKGILVDPLCGGYYAQLTDHYAQLTDQVNAYYNKHASYNIRKNRWRESLIQKYFDSPWSIISLVAAVILLILTAIQSFYAVFAYYRPNS